MNIDVFELVPDNDRPRKDCYNCLGCPHLVAVNVDSSHDAYIECDIVMKLYQNYSNKEDKQ